MTGFSTKQTGTDFRRQGQQNRYRFHQGERAPREGIRTRRGRGAAADEQAAGTTAPVPISGTTEPVPISPISLSHALSEKREPMPDSVRVPGKFASQVA